MFHETQGWRVGRIAGVEVSISFGYVFLIGWIVLRGLGGGSLGFAQGLSTAAMITLSVLIHELGHAMVSKYYKLRPSVLLHGFGGVCIHDEAPSDGRDALIVLAGPIVQMVAGLAALVFGMVVALPGSLGGVVSTFAWFSIVWGGANLILPLWPLDGGKLFHLILRRVVSERRARQVTLWVSMTLAVVGGVLGAVNGQIFLAFIALFILMDNWGALQADVPLVSRGGKPVAAKTGGAARELLTQAEQAFAAGEWRDAARLCHQARASRVAMSERDHGRMWELLALSALELGDMDEARDFIRLAPATPAVQAAQRRLNA